MIVVKYFFEEPTALEALTPDLEADARRTGAPSLSLAALLAQPRYHRGYLAATDLATGRIGLTAVPEPEVFTAPLQALLSPPFYHHPHDGLPVALDAGALASVLRDPSQTAALTAGAQPPVDTAEALGRTDRRAAIPALRATLDAGAVVLFPEPAHHGHDWSLFSPHPLREALADAFRQHRQPGLRVFAVPYQRARGEQHFYFEQHALEAYAPYEVT